MSDQTNDNKRLFAPVRLPLVNFLFLSVSVRPFSRPAAVVRASFCTAKIRAQYFRRLAASDAVESRRKPRRKLRVVGERRDVDNLALQRAGQDDFVRRARGLLRQGKRASGRPTDVENSFDYADSSRRLDRHANDERSSRSSADRRRDPRRGHRASFARAQLLPKLQPPKALRSGRPIR